MENLESLGNTIYKTMSARFTASRRMKRSRDASKVCEAMFSASIIAISLIALQKPEIKVANMISAFTIILSTFLLVLSLLFSSLNYDKRMENYHACGNELNRLYRLIKHDVSVLSKEEQEKKEIDYINKYEIPLSRMERIKRKFFYPYFYFKISLLIKRRHCRIYHESDKYVLLTSKFSSVFAQISGISKAEKLTAINNPITIETPSSVDWDKKQKICLFPARLVSQKGIDYLMSVWAKIEKVKTDWELVIVGDGPERSKIDKFIEAKNLQHVRLEGFKSDMKPYYGEASILIATSIYEGWPLTLSESMAYGCIPVLFNSYLAAGEIVDNGNTGFLVPPFDVDVFVQKLLFLMDNSAKRMFMAQTAVDTSGKYKIENVGEKWLTLFNSIQ